MSCLWQLVASDHLTHRTPLPRKGMWVADASEVGTQANAGFCEGLSAIRVTNDELGFCLFQPYVFWLPFKQFSPSKGIFLPVR